MSLQEMCTCFLSTIEKKYEKKKKRIRTQKSESFFRKFWVDAHIGLMLTFIFTVKLILKDTLKVKKILNKSIKTISFRTKYTVQKKSSVFFQELQLITVLLLIYDSYIRWSTRFVSLKLCVRFSIFDSISFLLQFIVLFNKMHGLFEFKTL